MTALLDSVILIDHFNGVSAATDTLSRLRGAACLSVITRAEVLTGFAVTDEAQPRRLLDAFETLPVAPEDADLAAALRRSFRWKLPDAFQAALAIRHGLRLVTRNTKDFDPARHPFVEVPNRL